MFKLVLSSLFLFPAIAMANSGVKANTDVAKRKVKEAYQVTRCIEGKCSVYEVTEFDKAVPMQGDYYAQCFFITEGTKRYMACSKDVKPKVVTVTKTVPVVRKVPVEKKVFVPVYIQPKKNRLSLHVGVGPTGLNYDESSNSTKVNEKRNVLLGAGYTRLLGKDVSLGVSGFTNKSAIVTLGFDF